MMILRCWVKMEVLTKEKTNNFFWSVAFSNDGREKYSWHWWSQVWSVESWWYCEIAATVLQKNARMSRTIVFLRCLISSFLPRPSMIAFQTFFILSIIYMYIGWSFKWWLSASVVGRVSMGWNASFECIYWGFGESRQKARSRTANRNGESKKRLYTKAFVCFCILKFSWNRFV